MDIDRVVHREQLIYRAQAASGRTLIMNYLPLIFRPGAVPGKAPITVNINQFQDAAGQTIGDLAAAKAEMGNFTQLHKLTGSFVDCFDIMF